MENTEHSNDPFAEELRGFGPTGIISLLFILLAGNITIATIVIPVGAILTLLWIKLSHTPWREIGYIRPKSWIITLIAGTIFGVAFKLLMKSFVMPLFGANPVNQTYHYLAHNQDMLPAATWAMLAAGFGEETVFRGYLFERSYKLFGHTEKIKVATVIIASLLFGLSHYFSQGPAGVDQAIVTGLAFGTIYAFTGRIFLIMIAHAAFDLTALAIIYWNVETDMAHWIFK